jgi:hypothetical protein
MDEDLFGAACIDECLDREPGISLPRNFSLANTQSISSPSVCRVHRTVAARLPFAKTPKIRSSGMSFFWPRYSSHNFTASGNSSYFSSRTSVPCPVPAIFRTRESLLTSYLSVTIYAKKGTAGEMDRNFSSRIFSYRKKYFQFFRKFLYKIFFKKISTNPSTVTVVNPVLRR